jgi:hypothetical protein
MLMNDGLVIEAESKADLSHFDGCNYCLASTAAAAAAVNLVCAAVFHFTLFSLHQCNDLILTL